VVKNKIVTGKDRKPDENIQVEHSIEFRHCSILLQTMCLRYFEHVCPVDPERLSYICHHADFTGKERRP